MKDILHDIVQHKLKVVAEDKAIVPQDYLRELCAEQASTVSMRDALLSSTTGIIAEFKRRSPSKDWINREAEIQLVAPAYQVSGAAAMSVLTDKKFFGGSLDDLKTASAHVDMPLLRKDFMIDEYQLYQARVYGADAVLLIAACLGPKECWKLAEKACELGLEVLLEIHSKEEIDYIIDEISLVGVNNRNLGTFHTDVNNSVRMAASLPTDKVWVAESGISDPEVVKELRALGYRGFLIGENFMKTSHPGAALAEFIQKVEA